MDWTTDGPRMAAAIIVTDPNLDKGDVFQQLRRSMRGRCAWASAPDVPAGGCATILNDAAAAKHIEAIVAL